MLAISDLHVAYGQSEVLHGLNVKVAPNEIVAIMGRNGMGKTTLMKSLMGILPSKSGSIDMNGTELSGLKSYERVAKGLAYVPQGRMIFSTMTVKENIETGLVVSGESEVPGDIYELFPVLLEMKGRRGGNLSGGQQQQLAIARALATKPKVLLLDEPMAALDKKLRESTQFELMELQRKLGMTFIIVTHDQEEAMTVASRIGVMKAGQLEQVAVPRRLYEEPASRWVAEFVGDINLFEGEVTAREALRLRVATSTAGELVVAQPVAPVAETKVAVAIRPEKIRLALRGPAADAAAAAAALNRVEGVITDASYLGGKTVYKIRLDGGAVLHAAQANTARLDADGYGVNQRVVAWFTPDDCVVLER